MADGIQWGTQRFQGNTQPNWHVDLTTDPTGDTILSGGQGGSGGLGHQARGYNANNIVYSRPNHPIAGENLEATDRGWERVVRYTDSAGTPRTKREVVVAQGGLANTLAYGAPESAGYKEIKYGPVITDIRWTTANNEIGRVSGVGGGDGYLFTRAGEVGVQVTFSEPVYVDETAARLSLTIASSEDPLTARCTSGNNTNKLVFTNTEAKAVNESLSLADHVSTFITVGSGKIYGTQANTGYGRVANTPYPELFRLANVATTGVKSATAHDTLTQAADAGIRLVKEV